MTVQCIYSLDVLKYRIDSKAHWINRSAGIEMLGFQASHREMKTQFEDQGVKHSMDQCYGHPKVF